MYQPISFKVGRHHSSQEIQREIERVRKLGDDDDVARKNAIYQLKKWFKHATESEREEK